MGKNLSLIILRLSRLNDIVSTLMLFYRASDRHSLTMKTLGTVNGLPILFLQPTTINPKKPRVLIAAGFHGNEIAGPIGLGLYLSKAKELPCNVSFLPMTNPTGFMINTRLNTEGRSPNDGWIHENELSEEGSIIMGHMDEILPATRDGFLTLHEDPDHDEFYLYVMSEKIPENMIQSLFEVGGRFFSVMENGTYTQKQESLVGTVHIEKGLVLNCHDGTFEDYLSHRGVPQTFCTETPMTGDLDKRILATVGLIETFLSKISQRGMSYGSQ
jgi:predicted deacylase